MTPQEIHFTKYLRKSIQSGNEIYASLCNIGKEK